jgi:hypothetical protein
MMQDGFIAVAIFRFTCFTGVFITPQRVLYLTFP